MKKYLLSFAVLIITISQMSMAFADTQPGDVKIAIKKYKAGNFSGCLQDCQNIVYKHPTNSLAYYYMAMAYVQAGKKAEAIQAYSKVLSLNPSNALYQYAAKGKRCLETPSQCNPKSVDNSSDIDRFIRQGSTLSPDVQNDFEQKHLDRMKEEMNNSKKQLNNLDLQGENESSDKGKVSSTKPSQKEIDSAMKILKSAGIEVSVPANNTISTTEQSKQKEISDAMQVLKSAGMNVNTNGNNNTNDNQSIQNATNSNNELMQVQALLGTNQSNNSNNDAMMNMLPYMIMQSKNGQSGYSPQMVQAVMMNSMMSNVNFDTEDKDNK